MDWDGGASQQAGRRIQLRQKEIREGVRDNSFGATNIRHNYSTQKYAAQKKHSRQGDCADSDANRMEWTWPRRAARRYVKVRSEELEDGQDEQSYQSSAEGHRLDGAVDRVTHGCVAVAVRYGADDGVERSQSAVHRDSDH